jgi:hypothetical protein
MKAQSIKDLGNNSWLIVVDGEHYKVYAPNIETAIIRAKAKASANL